MWKDIRLYIDKCKVCKSSHAIKKVVTPLTSIKINARFDRIGIDLVGPFNLSMNKNKYLLVVTEYFTKWAEVFPIPDKCAYTVANIIYRKILLRYGCFAMISGDQGTEFNNKLLDKILGLLSKIAYIFFS